MFCPEITRSTLSADEEFDASPENPNMTDSREDFRDVLARVDERTRAQGEDIRRIREAQERDVRDLKKDIQTNYVSKTEFYTIKKIFHAVLIALILLILNAIAGKVGFQ